MASHFNLEGKVAVVTGGNGGIGKGIAAGMAEAGAGVALVARDAEKTEAAARDIQSRFQVPVQGFTADVADENRMKEVAGQVAERLGGIDILVNNAGINIRKAPEEYRAEEWQAVLDINLTGAFVCARAVYPFMKARGGGKIICIGSMTSIMAGGKLAPYSASKGGIVQLARSLAIAWAPDNIQVNCILPGWIDTDLTRQARIDLPGLNDKVLSRTPAGRWGKPDDLAGTAVFLASPASDFVTGTALPVDGGFSIMII